MGTDRPGFSIPDTELLRRKCPDAWALGSPQCPVKTDWVARSWVRAGRHFQPRSPTRLPLAGAELPQKVATLSPGSQGAGGLTERDPDHVWGGQSLLERPSLKDFFPPSLSCLEELATNPSLFGFCSSSSPLENSDLFPTEDLALDNLASNGLGRLFLIRMLLPKPIKKLNELY